MSHITRSSQDYNDFMNQFEEDYGNSVDEINDDDIISYDDLYDDDDFYEPEYEDDFEYEDFDDTPINYDVQAYNDACKFKEPV